MKRIISTLGLGVLLTLSPRNTYQLQQEPINSDKDPHSQIIEEIIHSPVSTQDLAHLEDKLMSVPVTKDASVEVEVRESEINYNGLVLELAYQKTLKELDKTRRGISLIVLCDDGKGTGLYIGNIKNAAETLKKNLTGRVVLKEFYNDQELINYLLEPNDIKDNEKIKNIFWFGHGDYGSLWTDLKFSSKDSYLDEEDLASLTEKDLHRIRSRFTDDAILKLYTCHSMADNVVDKTIAKLISEYLDIDVIGANSWVFARGVAQSNGSIDTYYYPATRKDYSLEFNTSLPDPFYNGQGQWILIKSN